MSGPQRKRSSNPVDRLRAGVAPAAKTMLLRSGGYSLFRRVFPSHQVAILRYHAVCGPEGADYADPMISVTPEAFEAHARYLAGHYHVMPLPEAVERLGQKRPLPSNCVVITFDDGYADNLAAARVLHRHGLSATFYLTAGCLDGGAPFWPAEIRVLLRAMSATQIVITAGDRSTTIPLASETDRQRAVRTVTRLFKTSTIAHRERLREQLRDAAGHPTLPRFMLRWDDVAEMHRLGMTIGAHTVTHPNLPSAGEAAARDEIVGSKTRLERELGVPVTMFSYPNGGADRYYTPALQQIVSNAGFAAAASSRNAFAGPSSDLYALERIEVEERLEDLVFALEVERLAFRPEATHLPTGAPVSGARD